MQVFDYSVLLAEPDAGSGEAGWALAERLTEAGLRVIPALSQQDVRQAIAAGTDITAALIDWRLFSSELEFHAVLDDIQRQPGRPPVVLLSEQADERGIPAAAARRADSCFWLRADSPRFVAGQVERLVAEHVDDLMSEFLAELTGNPAETNWTIHRPGRNGQLEPALTPPSSPAAGQDAAGSG